MYAVILKSTLNSPHDDYDKMASHMNKLVQNEEGFIDIESYRNENGVGRIISYWKSMAAIEKWRKNQQHIHEKNLHIIHIRQYQQSDAPALASIFYHTIHNINCIDYSSEQIDAWAPSYLLEDLGFWQNKFSRTRPFVAVINDKIVGFAEFEENGHIDCFYVHYQYQNIAIGSALMKKIHLEATEKNIKHIYAEVSITAKLFFIKQGFKVTKNQNANIRNFILNNFLMEKYL